MAWESVPGSRKDVATGCNAEHEQVNRQLEHQQERPEGPKDKPKSRREQFSLPPSLPGPLPRPEHVEGSRARATAGGVNRRPYVGGHWALGCQVRTQVFMLIPVKMKGHPWAIVHGAARAQWGVYT